MKYSIGDTLKHKFIEEYLKIISIDNNSSLYICKVNQTSLYICRVNQRVSINQVHLSKNFVEKYYILMNQSLPKPFKCTGTNKPCYNSVNEAPGWCDSCLGMDSKATIEYKQEHQALFGEGLLMINPNDKIVKETLQINLCTCDFVKVILPYGCRCGGK